MNIIDSIYIALWGFLIYKILLFVVIIFIMTMLRRNMSDNIDTLKNDRKKMVLYRHITKSSSGRVASSLITCYNKHTNKELFNKIIGGNIDTPNIKSVMDFKPYGFDKSVKELYIYKNPTEFLKQYKIKLPSKYINKDVHVKCHQILDGDVLYMLGYKDANKFHYKYISSNKSYIFIKYLNIVTHSLTIIILGALIYFYPTNWSY